MRWLGVGALLATGLAGCAVGPNYRAPDITVPGAYGAAVPGAYGTAVAGGDGAANATGDVDLSQWWRALKDPELDSLIDRATRANPDVEIALTRLQEVRTQEAVHVSAALPTVAGSAAGGRGTGSDLSLAGAPPPLREGDNKGDLSQIREVAGFSASWELDLFGGYRRAIEAGKYDVGAAAAARNAVLISVIADVARHYVDLRGLQARLDILRANIAVAAQSRDLEQVRFDRGLTNELDLQLANRELATVRAQEPLLVSGISATQSDIAVLLGMYPEDLAAELARPEGFPDVPEHVASGLPLDLLRRRPDIHESERKLAAATARIGVATDRLFPHLALTGGLGTQSDSIGLQGSHIWAFGPSVYWPLLDFGALDAQVSNAHLQAHEQLVAYKKTIVGAVRDADNSMVNFAAQIQRLEALSQARVASERAVSLAQQRYDRGLTDFLNVVDAEHQQFTLEDEYTAARQSAADGFVSLCQALGGGWENYQSVPAIRRPEPAVIAAFHRLAAGGGTDR
jgi:NodT family efflux transporter outer membrane factor (OMF) lipoprotein